jgi:hypothetical protein
MSAVRTLAVMSFAVGLGLLFANSACGVDSIGVGDCRDIEFARCEAGHACGTVTDVAECKRFYRDHCLHGLALDKEPGSQVVQTCVKSLKAVAACGTGVALGDCAGATSSPSSLSQACDVVGVPEAISECHFLVPDVPPAPVSDAASDHTDSASPDAATDAASE